MRALFVLLFAALGTFAAHAQALPYHADPSARDLVPNLAAVPNIRFLTTADFPPFNYRDRTGELVGFNVDLSRAICADLAITCTIQAWPWEQAGRALEDGQGDALIAGLAMTPENGAWIIVRAAAASAADIAASARASEACASASARSASSSSRRAMRPRSAKPSISPSSRLLACQHRRRWA